MNNDIWSEQQAKKRRSWDHPIVKSYAEARVSYIFSHFAEKTMSCLELGAGDGFFSFPISMKVYELLVCDASSSMLTKNPIKTQLQRDIFDLGELKAFDLVFESNLLHHLDDDALALQLMTNQSKKYVVLVEPNPFHPLTILLYFLDPNERRSLRYRKRYTQQLAQAAGLELLDFTSFGLAPANRCPLWAWKILRFFERRIPLLGIENIFIFKKIEQ